MEIMESKYNTIISRIPDAIWIITVKLDTGKKHNPNNKIINQCPTSSRCSDSTGKHHCFLVRFPSGGSIEELRKKIIEKYKPIHITRMELGKFESIE